MTITTKITLLDGTAIPWLAWGNGSGAANKTPLESGKVALKAGFTHIDTAQVKAIMGRVVDIKLISQHSSMEPRKRQASVWPKLDSRKTMSILLLSVGPFFVTLTRLSALVLIQATSHSFANKRRTHQSRGFESVCAWNYPAARLPTQSPAYS